MLALTGSMKKLNQILNVLLRANLTFKNSLTLHKNYITQLCPCLSAHTETKKEQSITQLLLTSQTFFPFIFLIQMTVGDTYL